MTATVLIIDDDPVSLSNTDRILQQQNFKTCIASDGITGIDLAHEIKPNLILSDIMLPKMDGFSVLSEIRRSEDTSSIPFILLWEKSEIADAEASLDLAADHHLMKPLSRQGLLSAIAACLQKYERLEKRALEQQQYIESLERQLKQQQDLSEIQGLLIQKFARELRHPISNISLAIQMMGADATAATPQMQEFRLLEDECFRVIALLNDVSNCQELLLSSRIGVLQRLLMNGR